MALVWKEGAEHKAPAPQTPLLPARLLPALLSSTQIHVRFGFKPDIFSAEVIKTDTLLWKFGLPAFDLVKHIYKYVYIFKIKLSSVKQ